MIDFDEQRNTYTLIVRGAKITFYSLGDIISFAQKKYNLNLLTQLN